MTINDYVIFSGVIFIACFLFISTLNNKSQQQKIYELEERLFYLENVMSVHYYEDKLDEHYQFYYGDQ